MSSSFKFGSPASLEKCDFVTTFGAIYEHSPWIAEQTFDRGITAEHDQIETLHSLFCDVFLSADKEAQLGVIIAHPDLAGRAARAGELTKESTNEQASAGIDTLTEDEFNRFTELNDAYKAKFGFPFIMAVKGSNKYAILSGFEERIHHSPEQEFTRALAEINKIAAFRLADM
ncbi:2-oxo-4-hydroxy-4-carboxy-5-ureidoimidazoline decarboxylase [Marinobacterium sp. LSUCC0821]|jgi:2-oxo-4-hydroxy-4-carboxy-5-ureidoimidazoline decarboxylase|uniref:2-oxo-4-hydroxy-4-carboxy-5-ureidoimidazoline decarboxylase n=1 Tax=Marinobacterium sp. LSUCC0821 TaxID=2668067 RepID=UPI00145156A7|nr:2-oxo-4-hydroxy-4-carboxy-5-ureidoimidazoline decarboxylase [Marinobacterium sp. LSUCC0821]QJD71029.1 2-oxo-4-hydroxy-4-carboxy-5-ureidoimidazoline decarboxylase [Marinobacterium sp. LSUCC0821]